MMQGVRGGSNTIRKWELWRRWRWGIARERTHRQSKWTQERSSHPQREAVTKKGEDPRRKEPKGKVVAEQGTGDQ